MLDTQINIGQGYKGNQICWQIVGYKYEVGEHEEFGEEIGVQHSSEERKGQGSFTCLFFCILISVEGINKIKTVYFVLSKHPCGYIFTFKENSLEQCRDNN